MPTWDVDPKTDSLTRIAPTPGLVERHHQKIIEKNLDEIFRLTLLKSEYSTGKLHGGRIDSLAIDEIMNVLAIIEYKNKKDDAPVDQGFYYFGWVLDHPGEMKAYAKSKGIKTADQIEIKKTRIICIAPSFTKYELYMAPTFNTQYNIDIQLVTFTREGNKFSLHPAMDPTLPLCVSNGSARPLRRSKKVKSGVPKSQETDTQVYPNPEKSPVKQLVLRLKDPDWKFHNLFLKASEYILSFDGIEMHENTEYIGFRRLFNLFVLRGYAKHLKIITDLNTVKQEVLLELIRPYCEAYPQDQLVKTPSKYKKDGVTMEFIIKSPDDLALTFPIIELICENT